MPHSLAALIFMNKPDFGELRRVQIDPDIFSRGTGQPVALQEAVVYDFMPPLLGNRFRVEETLKRGVHFLDTTGSFMMAEEAYQEFANQELSGGNLVSALEAYKKGLQSAVGFAGAMSRLGDRALLSPAEIERFNLYRRFGALESGLVQALVAAGKDEKVDLPEYIKWLDRVRTLERDALLLNRQFFGLVPKYPDNDFPPGDPRIWERDTTLAGNLEVGTRLRDTYTEMQRYQSAAWISKEIGDQEAEIRYTELAQTDPGEEDSKYLDILWRIQDREERLRYPGRYP